MVIIFLILALFPILIFFLISILTTSLYILRAEFSQSENRRRNVQGLKIIVTFLLQLLVINGTRLNHQQMGENQVLCPLFRRNEGIGPKVAQYQTNMGMAQKNEVY